MEGCTVRNNGGDGIVATWEVTNCLVENNGGEGIVAMADVTNCVIENNGGLGLILVGGASASDNTIVGNSGYGVGVQGVQPGQSIHVNWCRIYGNGIYDFAVGYTCYAPTIDATHNYWGTADEAEIAERILDTNDDPGLISEVIFIPFVTAVGVYDISELVYSLNQNHPNPFNPATTISYDLPVARQTWLTIYSVDGRRVTTLVDGLSTAGRHEVVWTGTDDYGRQVPSGIYFYRLEAGEYAETKRMVLIR